MSAPYQIPWQAFAWQSFQQLSLLLAEQVYPGTLFEEYLKQGAPQYGIDLISTKYEDGRTTTVQCKKEKTIPEKELDKIFSIFLDGKRSADCARFILCTTADLQHEKQQESIARWKRKMMLENRIELETWDLTSIERLLAKSWALTARYFGKAAADAHCIAEVFNPNFPFLPAIADYIPRKITDVTNDEMRWFVSRNQLFELKDMFSHDALKAERICILGSPYFGKSTYLKQTAFLLHNPLDATEKFYPLLLEVKHIVVQPIEELLDQRYGDWKKLPFRSLVLFIDGLDEVRTDRFGDFLRNIYTFSTKFHNLHIVISCRRLFYEKYGVEGVLKNFRFYELFRLENEDVERYLNNALGNQYSVFANKVNQHKLINSLYHPFYIENLVREFKQTGDLPKSKIDVVRQFIRRAYDIARDRQLGNGENLNDEIVLFEKVIKRFALALQISGLNAFSNVQIQELFDAKERELLQHNSMVNANSDGWSFTNAMFQEHFAALALSGSDIHTIKRISSVGINIRKIRLKWLQTLASLLSILDESVPLFNELLEYMKADNLELLFMAEPAKFQWDFKYSLLEEILARVKQQQLRPMITSERSIGDFMDGIDLAVELLLSNIEDKDNSWVVKVFCCDVLSVMRLDRKYHDILRNVVVTEVYNAKEPYYAANLVDLLIIAQAATPAIVDALVKVETFTADHEYRQRVYDVIMQLKLSDAYFDYLLEGIQHLLTYNRSITRTGSEYSLEEALINTGNYLNICKLFDAISDKDWIEKFRYSTRDGKDFLQRLLNRCAELYPDIPWVIFPVVKYMMMLGNHHLREAHDEYDIFFKRTGSEWLALRIVLPELLTDKYWQVGAHIRPAVFDYLLFEMEDHNAGLREVRNVLWALRFRKEPEEFARFWQLCDDMLGGEMTREAKKNTTEAYEKAEAIKKANDKIYVLSRENMRQGILNFFSLYGKKSLDTEDLYIEPTEDLRRNKFDSNFLFRYFIDCKRDEAKRVTIKTCLKITENQEWFENYRIWYLLHNNKDPDLLYREIAKEYFDRNISTLCFTNCFWDIESGWRYLRNQAHVGELFEKFAFDAPVDRLLELLWVDHGGLRGWAHENTNQRKSIAELIVEKIGNHNIDKLKDKVHANMCIGIKCKEVMGTHIALASRFKITATRDIIWEQVLSGGFSHYSIYDLIAVYLELGGDSSKVVEYLMEWSDYSSFSYWKIAESLIDVYPKMVKDSLTKAIASDTLKDDDRLTANMYLSTLGEIDSFVYLVDQLKKTNRSPYHINGKTAVHNVDTAAALELIESVTYMLVDPAYSKMSINDSPRNIVLEWLNKFAAKSEVEMLMVLEFIYNHIDLLKPRFPDHAHLLNFYANKILEDFRASDKLVLTIERIKEELKVAGA